MMIVSKMVVTALAVCLCVCLGETTAVGDADINHADCGLEKEIKTYAQAVQSARPLMMNAQDVEPTEFPWHVGIFKYASKKFDNICGGSLISLRVVLSAAHCFYDPNSYSTLPATQFMVAAGSLHRTWYSSDPDRQESKVLEIHLGEKFAGMEKSFQEDIAFLLLATQLKYSEMVRPVCLSLSNPVLYKMQVTSGKSGYVAGWGLTETDEPSEVLKVLKIPIIQDRVCTEWSRTLHHTSFMTSDKICAGYFNASAVCPGDSGGGLVFLSQGRYYLRGLVSNSPNSDNPRQKCSPTYALFTNINSHKEWLQDKIQETSACKLKNGKAGRCRTLIGCPPAMELHKKGISPQPCPFGVDRVCCDECPSLPQNTKASKAFNYCVDMAEKVFACPADGGERCPTPSLAAQAFSNTPVAVTQIPYYVKLGKGKPSDIHWWCRGVLISERWVLSTAKCVQQKGPMQFARTGGGKQQRFTPSDTYSISKQVIHPTYNSTYSLVYNDISLLQLQTPVTFSKTVHPACLPTEEQLPSGLVFLGWSKELNGYAKTTMERILNTHCTSVFSQETENLPDGVRSATQVCARPRAAGDCRSYLSGSPLQAPNPEVPCTRLLTGLSSVRESQDCTRVFLRVVTFMSWIEETVWP